MPGLAFSAEGDGASLTQVKYYDGSEVAVDDEVTLILSTAGDAEIHRLH